MSVRFWSALVIAAIGCGTPTRPTARTDPPVVATSEPADPADAPASALVRIDGDRRKIEAPHGGQIKRLAVTPDGTAAITQDELGGIRLWPALDGSAEPRIVDLPPTRGLAITPDPRGFVVAALDQVGGLVIQIVDRDGIALQRASLRADPGHLGIEVTSKGVLAWRADHVIVRLSNEGAITSQLPVEAGQRIVAIAVAGERAVAVIATTAKQRARWLTLGDTLTWGAWIDAGDEVGGVIAVSPSGKRIASARHQTAQGLPQVVVIDTATGAVVANESVSIAGGLGFLDDHRLAVASLGAIQWLDLSAKTQPTAPVLTGLTDDLVDSGTMSVGGGKAIGVSNSELMITTPTSVSYLGYDLETPAVAAVGLDGQLMVGVRESFALLDANLNAMAMPSLGVPDGSVVSELRWISGTTWLLEWSRMQDGQTTLASVDIASPVPRPLRTSMPMVGLLLYEPSTRIVTLSLGATPEVAIYDPVRHKLDEVSKLPRPASYRQIELVPVAPELANGAKVVVIEMLDKMTMRWVRDPRDLTRGPSITIEGSIGAADRAGNVYVWKSTPAGLELAIYRDGRWVAALPTDGPVGVWPSPTGSHVVQISANRISMVARDGAKVWTLPLQGVTEAVWIDADTLGVLGAGGLARFEAKTGKLLAARCGWRFGLSSKPHPMSARVEPVCAQLR